MQFLGQFERVVDDIAQEIMMDAQSGIVNATLSKGQYEYFEKKLELLLKNFRGFETVSDEELEDALELANKTAKEYTHKDILWSWYTNIAVALELLVEAP